MAWTRDTPWRQGHVISHADFASLGLIAENETDIAVVISHDCDLASDNLADEPAAEVICASLIEKADGNFTHAKSPRRLHLEFDSGTAKQRIELVAHRRHIINKELLAAFQPWAPLSLPAQGLAVLQSWLASRYRRQALPDELVERLRPVVPKLEKIGKTHARGVIGFWLDYQPDEPTIPSDQVYELWISVVFAEDEAQFAQEAGTLATELDAAFRAEYFKSSTWQTIELRRCSAVSERDFTIRDTREAVEYKLEHLSLRTSPTGLING